MTEDLPPTGEHSEQVETAPVSDPSAHDAVKSKLPKPAIIGIAAGAVVLLVTVAAIVVPRLGAQPAAAPSESPSPTASAPSASPSPSPSDLAPLPRNPNMTDAEALERAENPRTGENWLADPVQIPEPDWATSDPGFWATLNGPTWYLVGHRGDNDIVSQELGGYLVEVTPSGEATIIIAPRPHEDGVAPSGRSFPLPIDTATYYDSLALPVAHTTSEGLVLDLRGPAYSRPSLEDFSSSTAAKFGGNEVLRLSRPAGVSWGGGVEAALGGMARDTAYVLRTPYGALYQLPASPLDDDVSWLSGNGLRTSEGFVDFFDQSCEDLVDPLVTLPPNNAGPWVLAGRAGGRDVLRPDPASPLAQAMYQEWVASADMGLGWDSGDIRPIEEYVAYPAFLAIPTDDGAAWWIFINREYSPRAWC